MIYDCFTFFNELDLLEIRLNVLNNVVDKFVLVEATKTHQGNEKSLIYNENKQRFSAFSDKIIHVIVDKFPDTESDLAWTLERYQRNMIAEGLKNCKAEDIILISDIDEIPDPVKINRYKDKKGIKIFLQHMFYYFLNCKNATLKENFRWPGTVMVRFDEFVSPQYYRDLSIAVTGFYSPRLIIRWYVKFNFYRRILVRGKRVIFVEDGGWHFSYLGGVQAIIKKLEAFAHTEYNTSQYKNAASIEDAINKGKDIFGRDFQYKFVPLDNTYPDYIKDNSSKFEHLIKSLDHVVQK
jgi:beta-1,4-mannosyl-glycoprotein beta-1,4-N-acetylglucosaminyltransferase